MARVQRMTRSISLCVVVVLATLAPSSSRGASTSEDGLWTELGLTQLGPAGVLGAHSYRSFRVDDGRLRQVLGEATATGRLDLTPAGFHAMLITAEGTVYLDPVSDSPDYLSYWKEYVPAEPFECGEEGSLGEAFSAASAAVAANRPSGALDANVGDANYDIGYRASDRAAGSVASKL